METNKSKSENAVSAGGGALAGGVAGGVAGAVLAGPLGIVPGAAAGAIGGLLAGRQAAEDLRPQILYPEGDLEHFQATFDRLPYYVQGMSWSDYEPAYRFAISEYQNLDQYRILEDVEGEIKDLWMASRASSRLDWNMARPVVSHVWTAYDSGEDPFGFVQPEQPL